MRKIHDFKIQKPIIRSLIANQPYTEAYISLALPLREMFIGPRNFGIVDFIKKNMEERKSDQTLQVYR